MPIRPRFILLLGLVAFGWSVPAEANLILSFDQPTYTIGGVGRTGQVNVLVSQVAGGPQVGPGNGLLTAAIKVTFDNPAGVAAVLSPGNVRGGPAFDSSSAGVTTTTATLAEASLLGITNLSSPLLLGTFTFTGLSVGRATISVAQLDPGTPDFITTQGNVLDPTNTA